MLRNHDANFFFSLQKQSYLMVTKISFYFLNGSVKQEQVRRK